MTLKKKDLSADEIAIYDDAIIYKRGAIWQFRMWLEREGKYARSGLGVHHSWYLPQLFEIFK